MFNVITEILGSKACQVRALALLILAFHLATGCNGQKGKSKIVSDQDEVVDITDIIDQKELRKHLGMPVKINGVAIEGKGYGDIETKYGKFVISGQHIWPREVVDKKVFVEGVLRNRKHGLPGQVESIEAPVQSSLPRDFYVIEDAIWNSKASLPSATKKNKTGSDPFFD